METKTLEKVLDVAGSAAKVAANMTEPKKEPPKQETKSETGSQNIQIHMDSGKKKEPKPIEKHIHEFPDNRAMTEQECELALKKAQMDYDIKKSDQAFGQKMYDREWQHKLEVERKNEKKGTIRRIIAGILAAGGLGYVGYTIWNDYRNNKAAAKAQEVK